MSLWVLLTFNSWKTAGLYHKLKGVGTLVGIVGYCFLSLSLVLSSRWKKLENWFGGLDQIYHIHRLIGIWGFCLILIHPLIMAVKWIPHRLDKFFLFFFPIHGRVSVNLGSYSLWLMIVILGVTLFKLLPYDKWKIIHKFMSIVFILASLHFLLSNRLFGSSVINKALLCIPMSLGFISIVYKQIIHEFFMNYPIYEVIGSKKLNFNTIEIFLKPKRGNISFIPGQYAFFSFRGFLLSRESHPFTLCGKPDGLNISIIAKARGDFTKSLYYHIKQRHLAYIEGPYGRFDYTKAENSQVWIAGGIGIVPFLIWAKLLHVSKNITKKIDLFYCIHKEQDAIFLDEFRQISEEFPSFRFFLFCSEKNNRLNAKKVQKTSDSLEERSILMCGPKRMTNDLLKQFLKLGINRKNIIFEDFEFL